MRNNAWLIEQLDLIWGNYFNDIPRLNVVEIKFGRYSRTLLGSIRLKSADQSNITKITITRYFSDIRIPEYVVHSTIAHELCHYAHGFFSPLEKSVKYPHKGDIVPKELNKRGMGKQLTSTEEWLKENWVKIVPKSRARSRTKRRRKLVTFKTFLRRFY